MANDATSKVNETMDQASNYAREAKNLVSEMGTVSNPA